MTAFEKARELLPQDLADEMYKTLADHGLSQNDPICVWLSILAVFTVKLEHRRRNKLHALYGALIAVAGMLGIWLGWTIHHSGYLPPTGDFYRTDSVIRFTPTNGRVSKVMEGHDGSWYIAIER